MFARQAMGLLEFASRLWQHGRNRSCAERFQRGLEAHRAALLHSASRVMRPPRLPQGDVRVDAPSSTLGLASAKQSQTDFLFPTLLDVHWRGAGRIWQKLVEDDTLKLPR